MKLSTDTRTIDLPSPRQPGQIYYAPHQRIRRAQAVQSGNDRILITLSWNALTPVQMATLEGFVRTTLMYSGYTCKIEDLLGQNYSPVRYVGGMDTARVWKGDRWSVSLRFEQVPSVSLPLEKNLITNPNLALNADGKSIDGWMVPDESTQPAVLSNVDISEDFASSAIEIADTDPDAETFLFSEKIPIANMTYTVVGWANRIAGNRSFSLFVEFYAENGARIPVSRPGTGWVGIAGNRAHYRFLILRGTSPPNTWGKGSVVFGPGSTTSVPPASKSFRIGMSVFYQATSAIYRVAGFSVIVTP